MGFFFSEVPGCEVTEEKDFIKVSFGWMFCEALSESFWKTLSDFTSVLEEVTVLVQVNFETCSLGIIQIPEARMRSDTCRFQ